MAIPSGYENVWLVKGSGTVLRYTTPDGTTGAYDGLDRDRNALQWLVETVGGSSSSASAGEQGWVETQPDGFRLLYVLPGTGSSSGSGSGSAGSSGGSSGSSGGSSGSSGSDASPTSGESGSGSNQSHITSLASDSLGSESASGEGSLPSGSGKSQSHVIISSLLPDSDSATVSDSSMMGSSGSGPSDGSPTPSGSGSSESAQASDSGGSSAESSGLSSGESSGSGSGSGLSGSGGSGLSGSGLSGSSSSTCPGPVELGCTRNLLGGDYALPPLGVPIQVPDAETMAQQPMLCGLDVEWWYGISAPLGQPWQSIPSLAQYGSSANTAALDRAHRLIRQWLNWYSWDDGFATAPARVNLTSGNLVVGFRTPAAGPADPPVAFYYNSQAEDWSEFGYGWTSLYQQRVQAYGGTLAWLTRLENAQQGLRWEIDRFPDGSVNKITDPYGRLTNFNYDGSGILQAVVDTGSRHTTFTVNDSQNLTQVQFPDGRGYRFDYASGHRLAAIAPSLGPTKRSEWVSFTYDGCRRVTAIQTAAVATPTKIDYLDTSSPRQRVITDPRGHLTTLTLDSYGNLHVVQTPEGITNTYTWDGLQRLTAIEDGQGDTVEFSYVSVPDLKVRRLASLEKPEGGQVDFTYNDAGYVTVIDDENGELTTLVWDEDLLWRTEVEDATNLRTTYGYLADGQLDSVLEPTPNVGSLSRFTTFHYDAVSRREAVENAEAHRTTYQYTAASQVQAVVDPLLHRTTYARDGVNRITEVLDANLNRTTYVYDPRGWLTEVRRGEGILQRTGYDVNGRVTSETDPENQLTQYQYDANGNRTLVQPPRRVTFTTFQYDRDNRLTHAYGSLNRVTSYAYDLANNQIARRDPMDFLWTMTYDGDHRLVLSEDPENHFTSYSYDPAGNQTAVRDAENQVASTEYDALQRVQVQIDQQGHRTTYSYDFFDIFSDPVVQQSAVRNAENEITTTSYYPDGLVSGVTDPEGHSTLNLYDAANRLVNVVSPLGQITTNLYDAGNRLVGETNPENHTTAYVYDTANRRVAVVNPLLQRTTTAYYKNDLVRSTTDPQNHTTLFIYDPDRNLQSENFPTGATRWHRYDAANRRGATYDEMQRPTFFGYDLNDRVIATQNGLGQISATDYWPDGMVKEQINAEGHRTTFTYDACNRPQETIVPLTVGVQITTTTYFPDGMVEAQIDPQGHRTTFTYDKVNRVTQVRNAANEVTTNTYWPDGLVKTTVDPIGRTTTNTYDAANRLQTVVTPGSVTATEVTTHTYWPDNQLMEVYQPGPNGTQVTTYMYDAANRQTTMVNSAGEVTTQAWYPDGMLASRTQPGSEGPETTDYVYDALNRTLQVINSAGEDSFTSYWLNGLVKETWNGLAAYTVRLYDAANRLVEEQRPFDEETSPATFYSYYPDGQLKTTQDAAGQVTTFVYDPANRRTAVVDANDGIVTTSYFVDNMVESTTSSPASGVTRTTTYTYDAVNRVKVVENPKGDTNQTSYYADGRVKTQVDGAGKTTTFTYDAAARQETVTTPIGAVTTSVYFPGGLLNASVGPLSRRTTFAYDNGNRRTQVQDATGARTTTVYYPGGLVQAVIDPLNRRTTFGYDAAGRRVLVQDAEGHRTTTTYDPVGRPIQVEDAEGRLTTSVYDLGNNRTQLIDPKGHVTTFIYDHLNRPTVQIDPLGRRTTSVYDPVGNRTKLERPTGEVVTFVYDLMNRLTREQTPTDVTTFVYDPASNLLSAENSVGLVTYSYDPRNLPLTAQDAADRTLTYTYDNAGRRRSMHVPGSGLYTYTYDPYGNVTDINSPTGTLEFAYDAMNRLTFRGKGDYEGTYGHDAAGQLRTIRHHLGVNQFHLTYTYDQAGNRTGLAETRFGSISILTTWTYDKTYQLLSEHRTEAGITALRSTYTYDDAGNRELKVDKDGTKTHYTCDAANQLLTEKNSLEGVTEYQYDDAGQRIQKDSATETVYYAWNAKGQLLTVEPPAGITTFQYDAVGMRRMKETPSETTGYHWDFKRLVSSYQNDTKHQYDYVALLSEYGELQEQVSLESGILLQYLDDAPGSILGLLENESGVVQNYSYDAWGVASSSSGADVANDFTYDGRVGYSWDSDGNFYDVKGNYYDPYAGVWLKPDPIGFACGDYNLRRYVHNNPVNETDPSGTTPVGQTTDGSLAAFKGYLERTFGLKEGQHYIVDEGATGRRGSWYIFTHASPYYTERRWQIYLAPELREIVKLLQESYPVNSYEWSVLRSLTDRDWNIEVTPSVGISNTPLSAEESETRSNLIFKYATGENLAPERGFLSYFLDNPDDQNRALAGLRLLGSFAQAATGAALITLGGPVGFVAGAWLLYRADEAALAAGATLKDAQPRQLGTDIMVAEGYTALAKKLGLSDDAAKFAGESAVMLLGFLEGGAGVAQAKRALAGRGAKAESELAETLKSIMKTRRMSGGLPTFVVGDVEVFGRTAKTSLEPYREFARTVFGRELPDNLTVRLVEGGLQTTGPNARQIRGFVSISGDKKTLWILKGHENNQVLLADELGHLVVGQRSSRLATENFHHKVSFRMLEGAVREGKVTLSPIEKAELQRALQAASQGR